MPFYEKKFDYLFEYNEHLLQFILKAIKLKVELAFTETYEAEYSSLEDLRASINPKKVLEFIQKPYYQVFEERNGFLNNLSIVDLLFNQGPHTLNYL
jgi:hypothetical protein